MKGETNMSGTIWALVPPIVAIALALWTKEVYFSSEFCRERCSLQNSTSLPPPRP